MCFCGLKEELSVESDLVVGAGIVEDDDFFWEFFVPFAVVLYDFEE